MPKHVGIVACSAEGAALCYRTFCMEAPKLMGEYMHPEVSVHTHPLAEYMKHITCEDWDQVANLMLSSAEKLAHIGAQLAICPDNTIHQAFDLFISRSPIPWLHIADVVATEAGRQGFRNVVITGTKYLMTGPVYPQALRKLGISYKIPNEENREAIDTIIFKELVNGVFEEKSRLHLNSVIGKFKDEGYDAVIPGCTEIPLLIDPKDCPLPTLDSTRLLARAAIKKALATERT
jgi:aspartate racemase